MYSASMAFDFETSRADQIGHLAIEVQRSLVPTRALQIVLLLDRPHARWISALAGRAGSSTFLALSTPAMGSFCGSSSPS